MKKYKIISAISILLFVVIAFAFNTNANDSITLINPNNNITVSINDSFLMVPNIVVTSDTNIQSGSLVVNNLPIDASISYTNVSGLSVSYNSSKGLYTVTGSGTASQYQTLFRSFQLTTGNTTASNVTLSFTINTG